MVCSCPGSLPKKSYGKFIPRFKIVGRHRPFCISKNALDVFQMPAFRNGRGELRFCGKNLSSLARQSSRSRRNLVQIYCSAIARLL